MRFKIFIFTVFITALSLFLADLDKSKYQPFVATEKKVKPNVRIANNTIKEVKALKGIINDKKQLSYAKFYPDLLERMENLKLCQKNNTNPSKKEIEDYVTKVFGRYSKDALIILSKENSSLDPDAYNVNVDKYQSIDNGLFQINDYWNRHRYTDICELYDWKRNIDIAYDIFVGRGYSWRAWSTCRHLTPCY